MMADPFSVAVSAITVIGAAITVADTLVTFIGELRNAPDEVMFLQNDVTDTRLILSNVKENAGEDRSLNVRLALPEGGCIYGSPEVIAKAEYLIKRMEKVLLDIESTLRDITKPRSLGGTVVIQRAWFLHRSRLRSLRQELRELKTSVAVHFSASSRCGDNPALLFRSVSG